MTNQTLAILTALSDDAKQDLGINPRFAAPFVTCGKCHIDITDFTNTEIAAHARFHQMLAEAPKSIPSQSNRPAPRLQRIPREIEDWLWR